jgi:CheY-like chemotaxis protein
MGQVVRPTALIVDNDAQQRELIGTLLEEIDLEVIEVASSEEAVNVLRVNAHKIVLIVAAMNLPSFMDGARLAIYAQQWPWIKVVVTSYNGQSAEHLPRPAVGMHEPWLPLNMLIHAETAVAAARHDLGSRVPKV